MQLEYSLALSKELNHLDLTFETDGVTLKNYWFRIVINEKKTYNDKMHAHSFYEIHLCVKGWARFFVDGKESFLRAGEMAFVPKRKMHQISDISDDFEKIVWGYDLLPGTQSKGRGELATLYRGLTEFRILPVEETTLVPFSMLLKNLREKRANWFECIKFYTYCFLVEQTRLLLRDEASGKADKDAVLKSGIEMEAAKLYILDNLQNGVTVQDVAKQLAVSERQLFRVCYREFGISVGEYIRQLKMERAKKLLEETDWSIGEIAEQVGYSDRFVFSKAFAAYEGLSPAKFRAALSA